MSDYVDEAVEQDDADPVLGSWRDTEPVWLPEHLEPAEKGVSQTFMAHFDRCRRSAFLYALHAGGASSAALERGSAGHEAIARSRLLAIENGESYVPPELAKVVVDEVLADASFAVPLSEHDFIRELVYRWAGETAIDGDRVVAVERLFSLDLGHGVTLRSKVDYAEVSADGGWYHVEDYKTSRAAATSEEVTRNRGDGSRMLKDFQLVAYAVSLAFGVPVDYVVCAACAGAGCGECRRGRREVPGPMPIATGARGVSAELVYPAIPVGDERVMLRRGGDLSQIELAQYLSSLQAMAKVLSEVVQTGDWRPVPGSHCRTVCPARHECPLPDALKGARTPINTHEDAVRAASEWWLLDAENKALLAEIKNWSKGQGGVSIQYGRDRELVWVPESKNTTDRDGLVQAALEAANFGVDFEPADFVRRSTYTRFKDRKREVG